MAARGRFSWCVALVVVVVAITGCQHSAPALQTTATPATPAPVPYVSHVTGVAFGNAVARATADGAPATDSRSSGADRAITANARTEGDEPKRSCGSQGAQSHAQATAAFQPLPVVGVRQFGFALSATSYARGGTWRDRFVICRGSHSTTAVANARVAGRVDLTYNGNSGESEQLILRVSGATPDEAYLEVRDGGGQLLPLTFVPGETWLAVTLAKPGTYTVRASITSVAQNSGGANAHEQNATTFSVSVQSMRDAVALGYGQGPVTALTLPFPVFISAETMQGVIDSALFTDQHRLYPCAKIDCGSDRLHDVYLSNPRISTGDGSVIVDMQLAGSYQVAVIFGGSVAGTVRATAAPVAEHDTLRLEDPRVDVTTHNVIVKWRAEAFEQKVLDRVRKLRIDLTPQLRAAVAKAQEQFFVQWSGACFLLTPKDAHVRSVRVVTTPPQGILADFDLEFAEASGSACESRKASR